MAAVAAASLSTFATDRATSETTGATQGPSQEARAAAARIRATSPPQGVAFSLPEPEKERIAFGWLGEAERYCFQIARDGAFEDVVQEHEGLREPYIIVRGLGVGRYHWRVGVGDQGGPYAWSEVYEFSVAMTEASKPH